MIADMLYGVAYVLDTAAYRAYRLYGRARAFEAHRQFYGWGGDAWR